MAISEDATTPGANTGTVTLGTLTVTTPASGTFSPPSSSLLVAIVSIGHGSGTPSVVVSDSGSHTWTTGPTINNGNTWAGIYTTYLSGGASNITVSAKNSTSQGQAMQLDVRVLDGAASSQSGAGSNSTSGSSASWTGSLTTTKTGSWSYIAVTGNVEATVTPNANTTTLNNYQASGGSSDLSGRQSTGTGTVTPGATTFGWTSGTSAAYAWAALEILPAAGGVSGSAADVASATGKAFGTAGGAAGIASATGTVAGAKHASGSATGNVSATGKAAPAVALVVNQWANSYGQGTTFTSITSALQSCVVPLNATYSVGGGTGTPTAGNWLFVLASWTQNPSLAEVHIGVGDDVREWYREYPASSASGNVRTSVAYCPNIGTFGSGNVPQNVYVAPDAEIAAITVLVVEVAGLGPWDTVGTGYPVKSYAAAATTLSLAGSAPGGTSFFIGAVGGDSAVAGQAFAPSGWTALHTVSQSNGSNQLASNVLTSAFLTSSSSSESVSGSASSSTDLSGFMLAVYTEGNSPVTGTNPAWPTVKFEAAFGSGFNTPDSEMTWTDLTTRLWDWDETTGIQFQLAQMQASNLTLELDDVDNYLAPLNSSSPYYPDVQPGTPVRIRFAMGSIGGNTVNRWYVIQRNATQWDEAISSVFRRYCEVSCTDLWAALSTTPPTFYRSEVYEDAPYAWWPCDDQPGSSGVLPTYLLNAAPGNTNVLNIAVNPSRGTVQPYYDTAGASTITGITGTPPATVPQWNNQAGYPPGMAVYQVGTSGGWMFGDPQSSTAAIEASTGNPVSATPGSAAWQATGQAGNTGSNGWFLYVNDNNFPGLSGGVTAEIWFKVPYYAGGTGWSTAASGADGAQTLTAITAQPYGQPVTIWEMATGSDPVCILQLSAGTPGNGGALNLITYAAGTSTGTTHAIYSNSDLRDNSWHMVTVELTTTTWQVWLDGGANADVSGSATAMTSAWTWLFACGDLGSNGGNTSGTGLIHGANMSLSHLAIYPVELPYYRVLDHYWAAVTAFGQLPAPSGVQVSMSAQEFTGYVLSATSRAQAGVQQNSFTADGSSNPQNGGYHATPGVGMSAVVTATAPGGITSGPSAWTAGSSSYSQAAVAFTGTTIKDYVDPFITWTGVAPTFQVYTGSSTASETESATTAGDSEAFTGGYGGAANGNGVSHVSGGTGATPPTAGSSIGDTVGQRIERLMRAGLTSSPNRCIDPAPLLVQAPGTSGGGVQAGAAVQAIQQSDGGMLFVDNLNNLSYWQRPHLASQYNSPVWNIGPSTGKYPYYPEIKWVDDPQRVWNVITIEPLSPTGASLPEITPQDSSAALASQAQNGAQPLAITSYLQSVTEMQNQANWLLSTYGTPQRRSEQIKIDAGPNSAMWPLVAGINVGDVVTLEDWQIGDGGNVYTMRVSSLRRHFEFGSTANGEGEIVAAVWLQLDWEPAYYWDVPESGYTADYLATYL